MNPALVEQARQIAAQYRIILEPDDDLGYVGHPLEMPGVFNDGATPDECVEKVRDIATSTIVYLLEEGRTPPMPADEAKRTEQLNVRLTAEEKLRIEDAARRHGFRGVSDFVRTTTLSHVDD